MHISAETQIKKLAHIYVRHGGKQNRRQQMRRLVKAVDWIFVNHKINRVEQIGKKQMRDFYRNHSTLSQATLLGYFYAFRELWEWLGRGRLTKE